MAQQLFPERRTRSQLNLPDDLLFSLPQRSPLKNARLAHADTEAYEQPGQNLMHSMLVPAEESRQKRSAEDSPTRHSEPPPERQVKRAKTALGSASRKRAGPSSRRTHARTASDPNTGRARSSTRKRSTPPAEPTPVADARGSVESESQPVNTRAQSVPLFPTSYSSPFIDLKNPPPSPRRVHSHPPEKEERKLEIIFEPVAVEENGEKMDVEEDTGSTIQEAPQSEGRTSTAPQTIEMHATITTDSSNSSSAFSEKHKAFTPSTPAPSRPGLTVALSPLTPLFETPQLLKSKNTGDPRQEPAPQLNDSQEHVKPQLVGASQMGSASGDLKNRFLSPPPTPSTSEDTILMGPPPARPGTQRNGFVVAGRKSSKSSDSDAFSVMMRASQEKTKLPIRSILDKGKQRAGVGPLAEDLLKINRSGATMKSGGLPGKVKARMRPREKPKVKPVLNLSVPPETDPETDEPLGRDHEPAMEHELSDSAPSIERPLPPVSKPTSVIDTPQQREPKSDAMDDTEHPMVATAQTMLPPDLPEEPIHHCLQDTSYIDTLPAAELGNALPPTSQDVSLPEDPAYRPNQEASSVDTLPAAELGNFMSPASQDVGLPLDVPEEHTHGPTPEVSSVDTLPPGESANLMHSTSWDVSEKPLTENAQDVELQEEAYLPAEPVDMDCDQPAGSSSDQESRPSQPPEAIVVPVSKASNSRGPRSNRKKSASTLIPMGRMTRSAASKLKATEPPATRSALRSNIPVTPRVTRLRSASTASPSGKSVTDTQRKGGSSKAALVADITFSSGTAGSSLPGKPSNYARPTTSSTAKVTKSPVKSSKASAFKPSRPSSTPGSRASSPGPFSRLFPAKVSPDLTAPSSLSTLSTALEKLRVPPPSRPSTSTGFYTTLDDSGTSTVVTHDAPKTGTAGLGKGLPSANVKSRRRSNSFTLPRTYGVVTAKSQPAGQQPISMFFASKQNSTSTGSDGPSRPSNKPPPQPRIFGVGSRGVFGVGMRSRAPKVSRKTSLPMVVGSPVKGGERDTRKDDVDDDDDSLEIVMDTRPDTSSLGEDEYFVPITGDSPKETGKKGKDKDDDGLQDKSSGRASLASLGLSASLNALPPKGSMGPPPIPKPRRITRSVSSGNTSTSQAKPLEIEEDDKSNTKAKSKAKGSSSIDSPLKFLKDCVAYVDVRTDDGDDAGSLFVEMLESAGAKLLTRVGQTCTHIIFKNGLLSTMSRYRLLRDPKPHVVGIAWVVECVEQRKHVDEGSFLIDLSEINVAGVNKRRKSLLPKLVAEELDGIVSQESDHGTEDGDRSMDGSNSSLILDDLPPLERARRRKSFLFGSRH